MQKMILFSSDARDLYKEDIFRAICLPTGYVVHFRYQRKYVDDNFLSNINNFDVTDDNQNKGVIFFSAGNDLSKPEAQRVIVNIPIREVKILKVLETSNTGLVHFYLQLEDFSNAKIDSNNPSEKLPPNKIAALLNITENTASEKIEWFQVVDKVKGYFSGQNFVSPKIIDKDGKDVTPHYDANLFESYYLIDSETNYILDLVYYRCVEDKDIISVKVGGDSISVGVPDNIRMGSNVDNRRFILNTNEIKTQEITSFIKFSPSNSSNSTNNSNSSFDVLLKLKLKRSYAKALIFGFLSTTLLFIATFKFIKDDSLLLNLSGGWLIAFLIIGFLIVSLILSYLYGTFNKK